MDAFFYIDKPSGQTSFDVLRDMRRILGVKKIGHTGTLDPLATGGLLVATGNYTKLIPYVEKDVKAYRATIMLDGTSPSYDSETPIEFLSLQKKEKFEHTLTREGIETTLQENFSGTISQIPPKYSALKIDGKRALDRTLAGEDIQMKAREAHIYKHTLVSFSYPELVVDFEVSAGTYIRSIAHDLGQILGTGGYLGALRRTKVGQLDISLALKKEDITPENCLDPKQIFGEKIYEFSDEGVYKRLSNGQRVKGDFPFPEGENIFLFAGGMVQYVVEYLDGVIHPRKKVV